MYSGRASADRLLIALALAAAIHLLVIFGLRFQQPAPDRPTPRKSLAVTLVRAPVKQAPRQPEMLAEQHQFGNGTAPKPPEPQTAPAPIAPPRPAVQPPPPPPVAPPKPKPAVIKPPPPKPPEKPRPERAEKSHDQPKAKTAPPSRQRAEKPAPQPPVAGAETHREHPPKPETRPAAPKRRVLTQRQAEKKIAAAEDSSPKESPAPRRLSAELLSQQISEVSSEVNHHREAEGRGPRVGYINSVNAQRYKAAAYEQAWQQKVERIGNLNYPDEARRQQLSGRLVVSAHIRPDGSLQKVEIDQSSGHAVLDEAAEHIVRMAAPFAPFPPELKRDYDILVITRTWRFYNDSRLDTD